MRPRSLAALLALGVLAGCTSGAAPVEKPAAPATQFALPVATAPPCEELPERPAAPRGEALPALTFPCLGPGTEVSLNRLTGRPTLVNLWATWCLPCREEMPFLQEAYVRHGQDIRFLGIDTQDHPEAAAAFLSDFGISYPHAVDADGELLQELGVRGLPVTVAVDEEGRIVERRVGQLTSEEVQELIDALLA